jgi:hypothetical protein
MSGSAAGRLYRSAGQDDATNLSQNVKYLT